MLQCGYIVDGKKSEFFNEFNKNKFHSSLKERKDRQEREKEQEAKMKLVSVDTTYHLCYACDNLLTKCVCIRSQFEVEVLRAKGDTARAVVAKCADVLIDIFSELPVSDCLTLPCLQNDRRNSNPLKQNEVKVVRESFFSLPMVARKRRYIGNTIMRYIFRRKKRYIGQYLQAWVHEKQECDHQQCDCIFVVEGVGEMKGYSFSTKLCDRISDVADDITSKYYLLRLGDQASILPLRSVPIVLCQRAEKNVLESNRMLPVLFPSEMKLKDKLSQIYLPGVSPLTETSTLLWDRVKDMAQKQKIEYILFGNLKSLLGRGYGKSRLRSLLCENNVWVTTFKTIIYEIMSEIVTPCSVKAVKEVCGVKGVFVSEKRLKKELEGLGFSIDKCSQNHSVVNDRSRVPRRDIYYGISDSGNNEKNDLARTPWGGRFVAFGPLIGVLLPRKRVDVQSTKEGVLRNIVAERPLVPAHLRSRLRDYGFHVGRGELMEMARTPGIGFVFSAKTKLIERDKKERSDRVSIKTRKKQRRDIDYVDSSLQEVQPENDDDVNLDNAPIVGYD